MVEIAKYTVIGACGILIYILAAYTLNLPRSRTSQSPSSFFTLSEIVSAKRRHVILLLYAAPLAGLYAAAALFSQSLLVPVRNLIASYASNIVDARYADQVQAGFAAIPAPLTPLLILVASAIFFAPYLRKPFLFYRDGLLSVSNLYDFIDDVAVRSAENILARKGATYDTATARLRESFGDFALPKELISSSDDIKLAYQLIFFSIPSTTIEGIQKGIQKSCRVAKLPALDNRKILPEYSRLFAGIVVLLILIGLYIVIIPEAAIFFKTIEWPKITERTRLSFYVLQRVLSFVIPLAYGVLAFVGRRRRLRDRESPWISLAVVGATAVTVSFGINLAFNGIDILHNDYGSSEPAHIRFLDSRLLVDAFLYALAPAVTLSIWVGCRETKLTSNVLTALLMAIGGGTWFGICQLIYEFDSERTGYYWHQALLGFFLTLSLYATSMVARRSH